METTNIEKELSYDEMKMNYETKYKQPYEDIHKTLKTLRTQVGDDTHGSVMTTLFFSHDRPHDSQKIHDDTSNIFLAFLRTVSEQMDVKVVSEIKTSYTTIRVFITGFYKLEDIEDKLPKFPKIEGFDSTFGYVCIDYARGSATCKKNIPCF